MAAPELSTVDEPRQVVNPATMGRGQVASQVRFFSEKLTGAATKTCTES